MPGRGAIPGCTDMLDCARSPPGRTAFGPVPRRTSGPAPMSGRDIGPESALVPGEPEAAPDRACGPEVTDVRLGGPELAAGHPGGSAAVGAAPGAPAAGARLNRAAA